MDRSARQQRTWKGLFAISLASYLAWTFVPLGCSLLLNDGTLVYALDDPYIHLAIARTWLGSHTVGISPGQFAPASSSPLWTTLLVGCTALFGLREWLPLALNVAFSVATLALFWWGRSRLLPPTAADMVGRRGTSIAIGVPLLLNLPGLTLSGMEHVLHAALVLAFAITLFDGLRRETLSYVPWLLAPALPLVRLESAFVIAAAALILLRHRKLGAAVALCALGALPVLALGAVMRAHGAFFLPNPVVAKAVPATLDGLAGKYGYTLLGLAAHPLLLVVLAFSLIYRRRYSGLAADGFLFCFVVAALHVALSTVGGIGLIDRYESYVVDLGLFFVLASPTVARAKAGIVERTLLVAGVVEKACVLGVALLATHEIYEQQYQTARLVQQQFPRGGVVVNDIGLVSLRSAGTVTDLAGLGSTDVLRALRKVTDSRELSVDAVQPLLDQNGADLIAIYTAWFSPRLYGGWQHVASWSLPGPPLVLGDSRVDFFATDIGRARELERRLRLFEDQLPKRVRVRYGQN